MSSLSKSKLCKFITIIAALSSVSAILTTAKQAEAFPAPTILSPGSSVKSNNQCVSLNAQADGNLVLYKQSNGQALWHTATYGRNVKQTIFQTDGNLVIYNTSNQPVWASNTDRRGATQLIVQDDGNVVMYNAKNQPIWATNTVTSCQPAPRRERDSKRKVNDFVNQWNGRTGITRYDFRDSWATGQCVTLIARYLQDHYGASKTSLTLDHGRGTAASVGRQFTNSFLPLSDKSDPIQGSIISFPQIGLRLPDGSISGHVALVVSSQRSGNNLNIQILDSNLDGAGSNSVVRLRNITVNTQNNTATGYGSSIQWVNPKD